MEPPHHTPHHPRFYRHSYYPYRRFGMMRRVWWFAIGAGVATWWIHAHDKREGREGRRWGWGLDGCRGDRALPPPPPQQPQQQHPVDYRYDWSTHRPAYRPPPVDFEPPVAPAVSVTPAAAPVAASPVAPVEEDKPRKSWRELRRERREQREQYERERRDAHEAQRDAASVPAHTPTATTSDDEARARFHAEAEAEWARIKETAAALWEDRTVVAGQASDQAREYTVQQLERLSAALDRLREGVKKDDGKGPEKRIV